MQGPRLIRSAAAFVLAFCTLLISPFATSAGDKPTEIMEVTEATNRQWSVNPEPMLRSIARTAEMDRNSANNALHGFRFPLPMEQKTDAGMGAAASAYSVDISRFSVS